MKRNRLLAIVAAMVFGLGSLAVAQEGYYGQQATTSQPAPQSEPAHRTACACGHMHGQSPASSSANQQKKGGAASQSEGDPNAPQNLVEYGG
jgi:hypothetical protein